MKPINILFSLPLLMASCSGITEKAPLVSGEIASGDSIMITTYYDLDGDSYIENIYADSLGKFSFDPEIPHGTDLSLYINGSSYGVHMENGSSVHIVIDSIGNATFSGDNLAESRWLTECLSGYDMSRYKHIKERDGEYNPTKYFDMIETARKSTEEILPEIANDSLRSYYQELGEQFYNLRKAAIFHYDYKNNKENTGEEYPEAEIEKLSQFNPNSDASRRSGALFDWAISQEMPRRNNFADKVIAIGDTLDKMIDNRANIRHLTNSYCEMLFSFNCPVNKIREVIDHLSDRLTPHQIEIMEKKINEIESRTKDGDKIPCDPVIVTPDGKKKTLTEACEGKIAYIDMWATWCGPCCAQIPFMEKIAEHYKNNDKVICISISCDEDLDAWHRKLDKDKPEWPQYVFQGESGQEFMKAMQVNGIPRFIIINPDMTLAKMEAPRPQNAEKVQEIIDRLISK